MVPGNFVNRGYCTSCVLAAAWVFLMAQSPFRKTILLLPSGNFYDVVQLMKDELPEDPIRISEGDEVTAIDAVAFRRESATIQSWEAAAIQWMKGELGPKRFAHPDMLRNDAIHTFPTARHLGSSVFEHLRISRQNVRLHPVLPPRVPIVTATSNEDLETIAENWQVIDWGIRALAIFVFGADQQNSSAVFGDPPIRLVTIGATFSSEPALLTALEAAAHETDSVWIAFIAPYLIPLPGAHLYEPVPADDVAYVAAGYRFERKPGGSVDRVPRFGEPATLINRLWFLDALMAYRNENGKPDRLCTFEQFAFEHAESESGDRSALQISEVVGGLPDLKNHGFLNFKHLKGWLDEFLKRAGRADGPLSKTLLGPSLRARLCSWTEKKSVKPMAARTRTDAQS